MRELHQAGWIVTVVSNKPVAVSEKILSHFGLMPYLSENIGGGSGFPLKPAPDALLYLMKKYAVEPVDVWVIGDNHTDLNFAKNSGVRSIFCKYGFGTRGDVPCTAEAETFSGCVAILSASLTEM
jgi:phosphoglycolate phosphatase